MFDFIRKPGAMSREDFQARLKEDGAWAVGHPRYRAGVGKRVDSIIGKDLAPFGEIADLFDAIIEVWVADTLQLESLMEEQARRRAVFTDRDRSFTAMTHEQRLV
jgi:hypothetical protein